MQTPANVPTPYTVVERPIPGKGAMRFKTVIVDRDGNDVALVYGESRAEAMQIAIFIADSVNAMQIAMLIADSVNKGN